MVQKSQSVAMNSFCVVLGCPNKDYSIIKLHTFPKVPALLRDWCFNLKKTPADLNSKSKVCALHFEASMVGLKRLKRGAIPTLFLGHNDDNIIRPRIGRCKLAHCECSVPKCSSVSPPCILFDFPEKPEKRMEWMKVCGLAHISWRQHFVICNRHFVNEPKVLNESSFPQLRLPSRCSYDDDARCAHGNVEKQLNSPLPAGSSSTLIQNNEIKSSIPSNVNTPTSSSHAAPALQIEASFHGVSPTPLIQTEPTSSVKVEIENEHSSPAPFNEHTPPTINGQIETTWPKSYLSPYIVQPEIIELNLRRRERSLLRVMRVKQPPPRTLSPLLTFGDDLSTEFMDIDKEFDALPGLPTPFNHLGSSPPIDLTEIKSEQESSLLASDPMTVIHSDPPIDQKEIKQEPSLLRDPSTPFVRYEASIDAIEIKHEPSLHGGSPAPSIHSESSSSIDQAEINQESSHHGNLSTPSELQTSNSRANSPTPFAPRTALSCRNCKKNLQFIKMHKSKLIKNQKRRQSKLKEQCNEIMKLKHQANVLKNVLYIKRLGTNIKLKIIPGGKGEILRF